MKNNSVKAKSKQKINTTLEENNDLLFNMSKQHNKIHLSVQHQGQLFKGQSESSMNDSQSINNLDKIVKVQKVKSIKQSKRTEANFLQQLQAFNPNQQLVFDQSYSSRSFNLQNNNELSQTNSSLVKNKQHPQLFLQTLQLSQIQANQQKLRNSQSNYNEQTPTQQNLNENGHIFQQIQDNHKDALKNNLKTLMKNSDIIQDRKSDTSIIQNKQTKRKNFIQKMFTSNKKKQDQIHNIRFEKGIQIIKNILPIQGQENFKIKQKVKQFIEQLKLYFPNRNTDILNEDIYKLIEDKSACEFMNRKNINSSLKSRIKFYLKFLASQQRHRDKKEEDKILNMLSNKLRNEIVEEINLKIINKHSLFIANFSQKVIKEILFLMEEIIVAPNEIIFKQQDTEDQSIYFVQSGLIQIFLTNNQDQSQKILSELSQDSMFGEISFFSGLPRSASARSLKSSTIYQINRQKFINLLKNYEEDFERYKMIQELIISQQNYKCLYSQCFSCRQLGHSAINCQKAHLNIDKHFVILKNNFSTFQDRENFVKQKKKYKSNFKQFTLINKQICHQLKIDCQNYNSYTQLLYKSDREQNNLTYEDTDSEESNYSDQTCQETTKQNQFKNSLTNIKSSLIQINDLNNQLISQSMNQLVNDTESKIDQNQIVCNLLQEGLHNKNHVNSNNQLNLEVIEELCKSYNQISENDQIINNLIFSQKNKINLQNNSYINHEYQQHSLSQKTRESLKSEGQSQNNQFLNIQKSRNSLPEDYINTSSSDLNSKKDDLIVNGYDQDNGKQLNNNKPAKAINNLININQSRNKTSNQSINYTSQNSLNQTYQSRFSKVLQNQNFKQFLNNYIQYNQKQNPTKVMIKQEENKFDITLEFFDKMQLFKRFFPLNNYDKIIKKIKIINQQNLKLKKIENKQKNTGKPQENDNQYSSFNKQNFKPTQVSYGISTSNKSKFPTKQF
ncbi:hypothetical protein ABPG73_000257 [Tetrahymena malaccensis]